jgi:hypothetical protein
MSFTTVLFPATVFTCSSNVFSRHDSQRWNVEQILLSLIPELDAHKIDLCWGFWRERNPHATT